MRQWISNSRPTRVFTQDGEELANIACKKHNNWCSHSIASNTKDFAHESDSASRVNWERHRGPTKLSEGTRAPVCVSCVEGQSLVMITTQPEVQQDPQAQSTQDAGCDARTNSNIFPLMFCLCAVWTPSFTSTGPICLCHIVHHIPRPASRVDWA